MLRLLAVGFWAIKAHTALVTNDDDVLLPATAVLETKSGMPGVAQRARPRYCTKR